MTPKRDTDTWAGRIDFDVTCKCGSNYRSQARTWVDIHGPVTMTRVPCPKCARTDSVLLVKPARRTKEKP